MAHHTCVQYFFNNRCFHSSKGSLRSAVLSPGSPVTAVKTGRAGGGQGDWQCGAGEAVFELWEWVAAVSGTQDLGAYSFTVLWQARLG